MHMVMARGKKQTRKTHTHTYHIHRSLTAQAACGPIDCRSNHRLVTVIVIVVAIVCVRAYIYPPHIYIYFSYTESRVSETGGEAKKSILEEKQQHSTPHYNSPYTRTCV